ncbi:hypothetical protein ACQP0C_32115 [Nocardia sp. CA-129566]|uniref:hypothetical protein n=1 Tax=Nocardia sp. CA-129566 TaxID=3239976 RepID=UPI003D98D78E
MADDTTAPRPMANMITAANEGQLAIEMKPEDFIYIDRDCQYFKDAIRKIQRTMREVSEQQHWGLGENNDRLVSARTLVDRFKKKAKGADDGNSVWEIMEQHYKIVEDIQQVHRTIRERMMQADSDFAAEFTSLETTLPERPPVSLPTGPYILPGGRTK